MDAQKIIQFQAIPAGGSFGGPTSKAGVIALSDKGCLWWMESGSKEWKAYQDLPKTANNSNRL